MTINSFCSSRLVKRNLSSHALTIDGWRHASGFTTKSGCFLTHFLQIPPGGHFAGLIELVEERGAGGDVELQDLVG